MIEKELLMKLNSVDIILLLLYRPGYTDMMNEPIDGRTKIVDYQRD